MATNSAAIVKIKKRWERAELWLEVASVVGGLMVGVGLWVEGETTIGQRLVIGGVAMEVICAWWVLVASRKLQNILETEFERLRLVTAEAVTRGEEAKRAAAEATARAAEANEKAEHERLERRKIEKKLAPRAFNSFQRETMLKQLKLVGEWATADLIAVAGTEEANGIAHQIWRLLADAGWKVAANPALRIDRIPTGILVESDPKDFGAPNIATSLAQTLRMCGGLLTVHESMTHREQFDSPIRITVGTQPL